jgi:hypothetical protein
VKGFMGERTTMEQTYFNGRLRVEVNDRGFVLWDDYVGKWILDASTLGDGAMATLSYRAKIDGKRGNGENKEIEIIPKKVTKIKKGKS